MIMYLQDDLGEHLLYNADGVKGVEIVDIQNNKLTLASEQSVDLYDMWIDGSSNLSWKSALKFIAPKVLEFNPFRLITSINIIDDLLFWTDGFTEPKKINITRSKKGSRSYGSNPKHTKLLAATPQRPPHRYI